VRVERVERGGVRPPEEYEFGALSSRRVAVLAREGVMEEEKMRISRFIRGIFWMHGVLPERAWKGCGCS